MIAHAPFRFRNCALKFNVHIFPDLYTMFQKNNSKIILPNVQFCDTQLLIKKTELLRWVDMLIAYGTAPTEYHRYSPSHSGS